MRERRLRVAATKRTGRRSVRRRPRHRARVRGRDHARGFKSRRLLLVVARIAAISFGISHVSVIAGAVVGGCCNWFTSW